MGEASNQTGVVNYEVIEKERATELQKSITERLNEVRESGTADSLRHLILNKIILANYETGIEELDRFIDTRGEYPNFQDRVKRYRDHCFNLIRAIETKRNFHGLGSLPLATQQEIYEKIVEHFEELKQNLGQIERVEKECRLEDIRSTVWVVRSVTYSAMVLFAIGFILEFRDGLGGSALVVIESLAGDLTARLIGILGL